HDVKAGQELIAFSEIKKGGTSKPIFVQRGSDKKFLKDFPVKTAANDAGAYAPLLEREAYKGYLDILENEEQAQSDGVKRAELRKKRIETSVKSRVLCPLTSLLVLETEEDYLRYDIKRTALADIVQIGKSGLEVVSRTPKPREFPPLPKDATLEQVVERRLQI